MGKAGKMSLRLTASVAAMVVSASAVACDQSTDGAPSAPTPGSGAPSVSPSVASTSRAGFIDQVAVSSASPTRGPAQSSNAPAVPSATPQGLQTVGQQLLLWEYDIRNDPFIQSTLLELPRPRLSVRRVVSVRRVRDRFVIWVRCERDRQKLEQVLEERLPILDIPSDAVVVELSTPFTVILRCTPPPRYYCVPPEVVDPITGVSTPGFGGLHFESDIATIHLMEPSQELGERLVWDELGRDRFDALREVRVLKADYTWEQLMEGNYTFGLTFSDI